MIDEFEKDLIRLQNGDRKIASRPLVVGKTPKALVLCGAKKELDITITKKVIDKILRPEIRDDKGHLIGNTGHGLTVDEFLRAIKELEKPTLVFERKATKSLLVVTMIKDRNNRNIVVAIELERREGFTEVNSIRSVYGREDIAFFIDKNINQGNLIAADKEKAEKMLRSIGKWYSEENTFISRIDTIMERMENVKDLDKIDKAPISLYDNRNFPRLVCWHIHN